MSKTTIPTNGLADSAVTTAKITDATIASGDLADDAVTAAKIADAVGLGKIGQVISTTKTDGICICLDGGTASYTLVDGMYIGAGEMIIIKCPNTTMGNLHAVSVTMDGTYGYPSAAHTGSVKCQIAAIIENV